MLYHPASRAVRPLLIAAALVSAALTQAPRLTAQGGTRGASARNLESRRDSEVRELERKSVEENMPGMKPDATPAARLALKQIGEDFRQLQLVNNEMMRAAFPVGAPRPLDYADISKATAEINRRAAHLRSNLQLPGGDAEAANKEEREIAGEREMRAALLSLDELIMGFVQNPTFRKQGVLDAQESARAHRDLLAIIKLSQKIRRRADKLK